ncbi:membrane protein insertase YidC [Actinocatenispora sera]|uniref:membrane protein insertase YidC n=1 Tax=Actinocatenispora sera TaxID=390989 RepID=UPI0033F3161C
MSLDFLYTAISWVMLRWHALWDAIGLGKNQFLGTDWDWVLAIVFLVITIRAVLFPLYVKQIKSQRAMQALQPKIKELQAKHKGGDKQAMQQEMMELYRKEKANPLMGCLPLALQAPVLLSLFHVLRHLSKVTGNHSEHFKSLYGWTAAQFDSASHAHLFGAPIAASFKSNQATLDALNSSALHVRIVAGVLIAAMIVTTFLTQRQMIARTGYATDPQQKMIQRVMLYGVPVMLLVSGSIFPIGVVIYWTTSNLFSLAQQSWILHKYPPPANAAKAAAEAGKPLKGKAAEEARKVVEQRREAAKALAPKPGAKPVRKRTTTTGTGAQSGTNGASRTAGSQPAKKTGAQPAKKTGVQPVKKAAAQKPAKKAAPGQAPAKKTGQSGTSKSGTGRTGTGSTNGAKVPGSSGTTASGKRKPGS